MKTDLKYASDINVGDFAIIHNGRAIVHGVDRDYTSRGERFSYATSNFVPGFTGRLGRVRDATADTRISGLHTLVDVHLVMRGYGEFEADKFNPGNLVLVADDQEIREYFAQNRGYLESVFSGPGWVPGILGGVHEIEKKSPDELLERALEDYAVLREFDVKQDVPYIEYLHFGDTAESAKRGAEAENELRGRLEGIDRFFEEGRRQMHHSPRIGAMA